MKSTKATARYQDTPRGVEHCSGCTMFRAPESCTAVVGTISPDGWCKFYEAKAKGVARKLMGK